MIKLPVVKDTPIKSECWTHYRMEIMQTSKDFDKWLCSHLDLTTLPNYPGLMFGKVGKRYGLGYYDRILDETEIKVNDMPPEKAIERIIQEIDNGYYIILFCNVSFVYDKDFEVPLHEVFIYGYDDGEEVFYTSHLKGAEFIEDKIPFNNLVAGYKDRYEYILNNKNKVLEMSAFFYDITKIKLKQFNYDNYFIISFFNKIKSELNGKSYIISDSNEEFDVKNIIYEGINCCQGIKKDIGRIIDKSFIITRNSNRLSLSLLKLYEHKSIILRNFNWIYNHYNINDPELKLQINNYEICCKNAKIMYLSAYKNDIYHGGNFAQIDDRTIQVYKKIISIIDNSFIYERDVLTRCLDLFYKWFYNWRFL